MTQEIVDAVKMLEQEKGIASDTLMDALQDALLSAYKKTPGAAKYAKVELDHSSADFRVYELMVPEDLEKRLLDEQFEDQLQAAEAAEAAGEPVPEIQATGPSVDPETGERRETVEEELEPERLEPFMDQIETRDVTPDDFGRIAAQTAKQVILQRIREAERGMMFEEYKDRVGELVTGIIQQSDNRYTLVQLRERVEALLPRSEQVYNERYDHGMRVKAVITDVSADTKGPSIVVSRRNSELIKKLFELEVPEIADKLVEITGVAREPGWRSKIAVISHADGVDPVGACVGPRGSRVRMVVSELRGEKIDIIPYNDEPARFVAKALSPARVREVLVDDETKEATVIVPDDQLSLAIGRDGQNARLAARLTGWKVDITSETDFAQQEEEIEYEGEEAADGRCKAVLTTGRRCPNAGLQGSQFCGLPQHQALARFSTNQVAVLGPVSDEEVATLAGADADGAAVKAIVEKAEAEFDEAAAAEEAAEEEAALEAGEQQPAAEEAQAPADEESEALVEASEEIAETDAAAEDDEEPEQESEPSETEEPVEEPEPAAEGDSEPEPEETADTPAGEAEPAESPDTPAGEAEPADSPDTPAGEAEDVAEDDEPSDDEAESESESEEAQDSEEAAVKAAEEQPAE
jgi:transcription termination/antitermination protein NusA